MGIVWVALFCKNEQSTLGAMRHRQPGALVSREKGDMTSQTLGLRVAAGLFWLMGLAHLVRLVAAAEVSLAGHELPVWASLPAAIILCGIGLWFWKLSTGLGSSGPAS